MHKATLAIGMLTALAFALPPASAASSWAVTVGDYYFQDANGNSYMTITTGDTVVFTNVAEQEHEAECHLKVTTGVEPTTCPEDFEADLEEAGSPGSSFSWQFNTAGTYVVHCNLGDSHATMKMVILVTP